MLPEDWADPSAGPIWYALPAEWKEILARYAGMGSSEALSAVFKTVGSDATRALLERDYIDSDYRDEFANFYAHTYRPLPDRCERLHFFSENGDKRRYLGFTVLRPVHGRPICRTMLRPPLALAPFVSCIARSTATPYGYPLSVRGFPFISQDYQYGVCAHAAIWMIAHYNHLAWGRPRFHTSDVVASARTHQDVWRLTPSEGLSYRQIFAALQDLQMPAIAYDLARLPGGETPDSISRRYLSSRLPVLLLTPSHASVLIGYGVNGDGQTFFVRHDDARGPYLTVSDLTADPLGSWERLLVPLPGRIYLAGEAAEVHGRFLFEQELGGRRELSFLAEDFATGRLRTKAYATTISDYRRAVRSRGLPDEVARLHASASASRWIWVVELQDGDASHRECVRGEIVIDATSDDAWPNQLFGNLPGLAMQWPALGAPTRYLSVTRYDKYETGAYLHP